MRRGAPGPTVAPAWQALLEEPQQPRHHGPLTPYPPQLESAATVGVGLVLGLIALLAVRASAAGFPGIADGEVPLWSVTPDQHLPEAFSVLGAPRWGGGCV